MRDRRVLVVLLLAILSGTVAGFSALRYMQQRPTRLVADDGGGSTQVVVAARALPPGSLIKAQDLRLMAWPAGSVPPGASTSIEGVVDRGLITPLAPNEMILESKLAQRGAGGGLPVLIPEGMRALSIRTDEVVGVAGFVVPGTRVDILLTTQPRGAQEPMTKVIMQNVQTLTAGQIIERDAEGKPLTATVVTLLVTPEEAEELAMATQGRIQLALRNWMDSEEVTTQGARITSLMGEAARPRNRIVRGETQGPQSGIIEFYRAGQRTLIAY